MIYLYSKKPNEALDTLSQQLALDGCQVCIKIDDNIDISRKRLLPEGVHIVMGKLSDDEAIYSKTVQSYINSSRALHDQVVSKLPENYSVPKGFSPICDKYGFYALEGKIAKQTVYVMPENASSTMRIYFDYLQTKILKSQGIEEINYLGVFGLNKYEIDNMLLPLQREKIRINCLCQDLEGRICISTLEGCDQGQKEQCIGQVCKTFEKELFTLSRSSLAQVAVDFLKLKNKKLCLAESVTGGLIASKIVDVSGASQVLYEGVVTYTNKSKHCRLRVSNKDLETFSAVSSQVGIQMVQGLLDDGNCDYAMSITGYADKSIDFSAGMCYICIGNNEFVSTSQRTYGGDRNEVRRKMANCAIFLLLDFLKHF